MPKTLPELLQANSVSQSDLVYMTLDPGGAPKDRKVPLSVATAAVTALAVGAGDTADAAAADAATALAAASVASGAASAAGVTATAAQAAADAAQGTADTVAADLDEHRDATLLVHGIPNTADLLVLKADGSIEFVEASSDPALASAPAADVLRLVGWNGEWFFKSATDEVRVFPNWHTEFARLTADHAFTVGQTTMADVGSGSNKIVLPGLANTWHMLTGMAFYTADAAGDIQLGFQGPADCEFDGHILGPSIDVATSGTGNVVSGQTANVPSTPTTTAAVSTATATHGGLTGASGNKSVSAGGIVSKNLGAVAGSTWVAKFDFLVHFVTAGNVVLRGAQRVSNATSSIVLAKTHFKLEQVG